MVATCSSERMEKGIFLQPQGNKWTWFLSYPYENWDGTAENHKIKFQNELMWRTNRNTCVILNHQWLN
jgi:hypothetical protein